MSGAQMTCDNCGAAYLLTNSSGEVTQHCSDENYNSPDYTEEMMLEDWGTGRCRYWFPGERTEQK